MNNQFLDFKLIKIANATDILEQCQGKGEKGLLVSFPLEDAEMQAFLAKILGAVKLDLEKDVFLLKKTAKNDCSLTALRSQLTFDKVFLFGITPNKLGISCNYQKYQSFEINGITFLIADDLPKINSQKNLKMALWQALQKIFQ